MKRGDLNPQHGTLAPSKRFPAVLTAPFATFWAAYPVRRPNPRAIAADAFARACKEVTPEQLIAAAKAYAIEVKERGIAEAFIVHTRTWLHQRRYLDYLAAPEAAAPAPTPSEPEHPLWPRLQAHMDATTFGAWIGRCGIHQETEELLVLMAPSRFHADHVRAEYRPLIERAIGKPFGIVWEIKKP